ncbi:MAG: hypothetical protein AABW71_00890 [Nanoarchaeota archaeon]
MKFNFRKITSAMASTAMLGLTVATAAAANFPAPFVQNGNADVAIVYGNSLDLSAVTDISTALSSALSSGSSGAPASTEAYELFTSSTPIQLNNSLSSVRSSVTDSNLPTVLGEVEFSGNVEAEASFKIVLGSNPRVMFAKEPSSSFDPSAGLLYGTTAATYLYNSTVTFDEAVNFTDSESEGQEITLFGQKFTVSSATSTTKLILFKSAETLFLSVGSTSSVPSQTVEVEGETYTIELVAASDTSATVKVTNSAGQSDQKEINEAASKKIMGVEVAVNTADESTATNIIQAEILVGANRLTFQDGSEVKVGTDETAIDGTQVDFETSGTYPGNLTKLTVQVFADDGSEDFIKKGDEFVDPVFGSFRLVFDDLTADLESDEREDIVVKPSGTDTGSITFTSWEGETLSDWEWLNNRSSGRTGVWLGDGNDWELEVAEMAQVNQSGSTVLGNQDEGVLIELTDIQNGTTGFADDYIEVRNLVTGATKRGDATSEGSGTIDIAGNSYTFSYIKNPSSDGGQFVRFNQPDSTGTNMILWPTIETSKGANLAFYEPITINLTAWDGTNGLLGSNVVVPDGDGYTNVALASASGLHNFTVASSATAINTTAADGVSSLTTTVGTLTLNFTSTGVINQTKVYVMDSGAVISRPAIILFEEKDEADVYNTLIVETSGAGVSDNGVSVSEASFSWNSDNDMKGNAYGSTGLQTEANDKIYQKMDQWGTMVETDQSDSDQYIMTISYPEVQTTAMIYIDGLVDGSSSGSLGNVRVMDTELASSGMSGKNLIVVGGSCVNSAASTLLSNAGCGASWTAATGAGSGEWIIQTFANPWASSKIATLVAGWEQGDTANAATYLTTQEPVTNVGQKLTGTTATAATSVAA